MNRTASVQELLSAAREDDVIVRINPLLQDCDSSTEAAELMDQPGEDGVSPYERVRSALPPDTEAELHVDRHGLLLRWPASFLQRYWLVTGLAVLALVVCLGLFMTFYLTR